MLEDPFGPPIWRVNSVNIWNLLWLSSRLILHKHFSYYLNSSNAKNHEISVHSSTDAILANYVTQRRNFEIQNVLVSKRRTLLSWKAVNRYKSSASYA